MMTQTAAASVDLHHRLTAGLFHLNVKHTIESVSSHFTVFQFLRVGLGLGLRVRIGVWG